MAKLKAELFIHMLERIQEKEQTFLLYMQNEQPSAVDYTYVLDKVYQDGKNYCLLCTGYYIERHKGFPDKIYHREEYINLNGVAKIVPNGTKQELAIKLRRALDSRAVQPQVQPIENRVDSTAQLKKQQIDSWQWLSVD